MTERLEFANILRGLAAIIVVILAHYGTAFFLVPEAVSALIHIPSLAFEKVPFPFSIFYKVGFRGADVGVALFFLISGFVIPFSLLHYTKIQFGIARLFRIWPTYILGLVVTLVALKVSTSYYHTQWPYTMEHILLQMLLLRDIAWLPSIDGVSWTLEIEIKFYLLSALLLMTIYKKMQYFYLLLIAIISFVILYSLGEVYNDVATRAYQLVYVFQMSIIFITFMFIGVLFNFHHRKGISSKKLMFSVLFLFILFVLDWKLSLIDSMNITTVLNYLLALSIFGIMYIFRFNIKANKILDFFADISYPLYIVHPIVGYIFMRIFLDKYPKEKIMAVIIAFSLSVVLAYIIHLTVEKNSISMAKKMIKNINL